MRGEAPHLVGLDLIELDRPKPNLYNYENSQKIENTKLARSWPGRYMTRYTGSYTGLHEKRDIFRIRTPFSMILGSLESQQQALHYYA